MPQFEHLRLGPHKGLQGAELLDLGRINVICGPNNSGKTTLLDCIASEKLRSPGITPEPEVANGLAARSVGFAGWAENDLGRNQRYLDLVRNALNTKRYWFAGEAQQLWNQIEPVWAANFGNYARPVTQLQNQFEGQFSIPVNAVLVPPKRQLETSKNVNSSQKIETDGRGLLDFLFLGKNQDKSSQARKDYDRISEAFRNITQEFEFDVFLQAETIIRLRFRRSDNEWVDAENCGLGLQDILVMLYFAISGGHDVVLIEEPENHLHPEIQRRLFSFVREETKRQFFLSTHSSVFLNTQLADRVFLCRFDKLVTVQNATSRAKILSELGYSIADNLVSDVIVLCEGPTDRAVLEQFFAKLGLNERVNMKVWPLGGDIMDQLDLSVFSENYKVVAIIDKDPGSAPIRKRFLKRCGELGVKCHQLKRYALENYFSLRAIKEVMKGTPIKIEKIDFDKPVADQLGFQVKGNAARIANEMRLDEITGTDLLEFLEKLSGS